MVDLEHKDAYVLIKVSACQNDINPYKQLSILNNLYEDYEIEHYGFISFVLTQIISIKDCYGSVFLFKSNWL